MHFHCEMAVAQHEVVTKSATHVTLIRGQPCSVAVALKEIGDPRSLWDQTTAMLCNSGCWEKSSQKAHNILPWKHGSFIPLMTHGAL